ncbi:MAG: response regulator transcription factor [Planctomycetota bacterium]|jgi:two-component system alkaline phosphatase synthesis response regulator PhoP
MTNQSADNPRPAKILIVEDEEDMVRGLQFNLEARGYAVVTARDGESGYHAALAEEPDLVLLDIMLPKRDGYEVCRALRQERPDLPIVMLTARSQEEEVVLGLKLGADDYVKKPFGVAELVARIEAVLRRTASGSDGDVETRFGNVFIDFARHVARKDDDDITLTPKEFEILRFFTSRRGQVVSRHDLLNSVWGYAGSPNTRTVDAHIVKLRQKIEDDPRHPKHILTVHGLGYKFIG